MKTFDVPQWITELLLANGVTDDSYHLYGAGRALGFVRMAARVLDESDTSEKLALKEAEYHTYSGISASRTAIDAIASWLNIRLSLGLEFNAQVNLSRKEFRGKVLKVNPALNDSVKDLGELGKLIDKFRQRAQHREGLAIIHHRESIEKGHKGGWYLAPEGLSGNRIDDLLLTEMILSWADEIEANLRAIHKRLV